MEYLNLLHLSDLHIGNFKYDDPETLAINIKNVLEDHNRAVDLIIFTGDVFDGRSTTYDQDIKNAVIFFESLILYLNEANLSINKLTNDDVVFVPGNHDLVRDSENQYSKYDSFINAFYKNGSSSRVTIVDKYNFVCTYPDKKIAILGFNSCKVKTEAIRENDLKWIKNLDLSTVNGDTEAIRNAIREDREKEIKWDDFGYIEPREINNVFTDFKRIAKNHNDYNVLAIFHHHFYPFPEVNNGKPDASFIRNYTDVMNQFQRHNIKLVLHGHKHLSIHRAVTDQRYFDDPESVVYVLSAGSVGSKDVHNPSFQWLRFFNRENNRLAEVQKYDYKDQQLETIKNFMIPPRGADEKATSINLLENLKTDDPKLHREYEELTDLFEQIILDNKITHLIDVIGRLFTIFNDIKIELRTKPLINYMIMLTLNYRTIFLRNHYQPDTKLLELLQKLESAIKLHLNTSFALKLIDFLNAIHKKDVEDKYNGIIKNVSASEKKIGAYCSIALFLADLFLNISDYGEYYFSEEKLTHKINIKLNQGVFYNAIPSDSLSIEGDIDRRSITINFKSKNPTAHKVAVLIVKDFEMRLDKFEDSLKEIRLKLYYITPNVQVDNYDLENFHFDAYIPTLLPLLTGDNLYKSKEVFIRELVQNAIDATLFRQKLQPNQKFDPQIKIELGSVVRDGKKVKFFRITDQGTGMSKFTIERYFTSIGRSFYVSEEFDDLKKDKSIQYNAISNFGIGFLSCFMVCKEILVKTKSIAQDDDNLEKGLEIEIPNYDGCFFIRKYDLQDYGTEINLFEDERNLFDTKRFIAYMKETFIGLPISLHIQKPGGKKNELVIEAYSKQKEMLQQAKSGHHFIFFIPFLEKQKALGALSWQNYINTEEDQLNPFGIWIDFDQLSDRSEKNHISVSNQGLKVSTPFVPINLEMNKYSPKIHVNFPSSFIQLDVSRENILSVSDGVSFQSFTSLLRDQMFGYLRSIKQNDFSLPLSKLDSIQTHLSLIDPVIFKNIEWPYKFLMSIETDGDSFCFKIVEKSDLANHDPHKTLYFDPSNDVYYMDLMRFLESKKTKISTIKKAINSIKELLDYKITIENDTFIDSNIVYHNSHFERLQRNVQHKILHSFTHSDLKFDSSFLHIDHAYGMKDHFSLKSKEKLTEGHFRKNFFLAYFSGRIDSKFNFVDSFINSLFLVKQMAYINYTSQDYTKFELTIKYEELGII